MITVLRRGGLANDYGIPWILGYYIMNIISKDLTKKQTFSFGKKSFVGGGMSIWLYLYMGVGEYGQMITLLQKFPIPVINPAYEPANSGRKLRLFEV